MDIKILTHLDVLLVDRIKFLLQERYGYSGGCTFVDEADRVDLLLFFVDYDRCGSDMIDSLLEEYREFVKITTCKKIIFASFDKLVSDSEQTAAVEKAIVYNGRCGISEVIIYRMPQLFAPAVECSVFKDLQTVDDCTVLSLIYLDNAVAEVIKAIDGYARRVTGSYYALAQDKYAISVQDLKNKIDNIKATFETNRLPRLVSDFDRHLFVTLMSHNSAFITESAEGRPALDLGIYGEFCFEKIMPGASADITAEFCSKYLYGINTEVLVSSDGINASLGENQRMVLPSGRTVTITNESEQAAYVMVWTLA